MNRRELFKGLGATMAAVALAATAKDKKTTVTLPPPEEGKQVLIKNLGPHETIVVVSDGQAWHQV